MDDLAVATVSSSEWSSIQRRIAGELDLEFVRAGRLDTEWAGYPATTPFLVLQARSSLDRMRAKDLVGDLSGINDLMWDYGWEGRRLVDGSIVAEIKLFPMSDT